EVFEMRWGENPRRRGGEGQDAPSCLLGNRFSRVSVRHRLCKQLWEGTCSFYVREGMLQDGLTVDLELLARDCQCLNALVEFRELLFNSGDDARLFVEGRNRNLQRGKSVVR